MAQLVVVTLAVHMHSCALPSALLVLHAQTVYIEMINCLLEINLYLYILHMYMYMCNVFLGYDIP